MSSSPHIEPLPVEVVKQLQKLLKNAHKKDTELKTAVTKALNIQKEGALPLRDPEVETQSPEYEKNINVLVAPLLMCMDPPQGKSVKACLNTLQRIIAAGFISETVLVYEKDNPLPLPEKLFSRITDRACRCGDAVDEGTQAALVKFLQTTSVSGAHGAALLMGVHCLYNLFAASKQKSPVFAAAKTAITEIINYIFQKVKTTRRVKTNISVMNLTDLASTPPHFRSHSPSFHALEAKSPDGDDTHRFIRELLIDIIDNAVDGANVLPGPGAKKDGIIVEDSTFDDFCMIFNFICKASTDFSKNVKEVQNMHGKLLALQIMHSVISHSGPTLRTSKHFVNEVLRDHIMNSLMANATANVPKVFQYVLSIFMEALIHFREFLKDEIGAFFNKVIFARMIGENQSQELYWILQVFLQIARDPNMEMDIFVNYDCDPDQTEIFLKSVELLAKIASLPLNSSQRNISSQYYQDFQVRTLALKCLATLTQSLSDWKDINHLTADKSPSPPQDQVLAYREKKRRIEEGIQIFNKSAKRGIDYFVKIGELQKTPEDVAAFFKNAKGLDKTELGDFLGRGDEFNTAVLNAYADGYNFKSMEFDLALRLFLSSFRLPGESHPISHIMECFARKYYNDNIAQTQFENIDAAYILSYSTIMLATDLHNPSNKVRMTIPQWLKNNAKVNNRKDFDEQFLLGIYERISKSPLKLIDDSPAPAVPLDDISLKKSNQSTKSTPYIQSRKSIYMKYMMEPMCSTLKSVFDFFMNNTEDPGVLEVALRGFQNSIHISGMFGLEPQLSQFLESLISHTKLENNSTNIRDISRKNVDTIRTVVIVALLDGNYLQTAWLQILKCFSVLAQLLKMGTVHEIIDPDVESPIIAQYKNELGEFKHSIQVSREFSSDPPAPNASKQQDIVIFDATQLIQIMRQITLNSLSLNEESLVHFIESLSKVFQDEIGVANYQGIFSLQKLVDVSYYNLSRTGLIWIKIWQILLPCFVKVGTHENSGIRKDVLDSSFYLVNHFLKRDQEISGNEEDQSVFPDSFYKDLFYPFDRIVRGTTDQPTRTWVLHYSSQLTQNHCKKIRSGWKTVFSIFTAVANAADVNIAETGFGIVEDILREYFQFFAPLYFLDFVTCVRAYANSKSPHISMRAIDAVSSSAVHLANGRVCQLTSVKVDSNLPTTSDQSAPVMKQFTDTSEHVVLWTNVLTSLSEVVTTHDLPHVRICALDTLERILALFGSMFTPKLWEMISRFVLLPIFNNVGYSKGKIRFPEESQEWLSSTCPSAFKLLVDVFSSFVESLDFMTAEFLQIFVSCLLQDDNEELLRLGAYSLLELVSKNGTKFSQPVWNLVCNKIKIVCATIAGNDVLISNIIQSLATPLPQSTPASPSTDIKSLPLTNQKSIQNIELKPVGLTTQKSVGTLNGSTIVGASTTPSSPRNPPTRTTSERKKSSSPPVNTNSQTPSLAHSHSQFLTKFPGIIALQWMVQSIDTLSLNHKQYANLSCENLMTMARCLDVSYSFCGKLLDNTITARPDVLDILSSTELHSLSCYYRILFLLYTEKDPANIKVQRLLTRRCFDTLSQYLGKVRISYRIIVQILAAYLATDDIQFSENIGAFYNLFLALMADENEEIRKVLRGIFVRIGGLKGNILPKKAANNHFKPQPTFTNVNLNNLSALVS